MARSFDYSKWDKIELSDDESDCHPNIDKQSWFRMKHRSRLEREEREDIEIKEWELQNREAQGRLNIITARLKGLKSGQVDEDAEFEDTEALEVEAAQLNKEINERNKKRDEYLERRKWNIDNICKVTEEKTVVSSGQTASLKAEDFVPTGATAAALAAKESETADSAALPTPPPAAAAPISAPVSAPSAPTPAAAAAAAAAPSSSSSSSSSATAKKASAAAVPVGPQPDKIREKFAVISYNDYVLKHEQLLETYSVIRDLEETQNFLFKNCDVLLHEHAQSYMLLSCLEDEMNGKSERMKLVCRQSQILSHITELGQSMKRDPRDVILPFFKRISEMEYLKGFLQAVEDFRVRIQKRAVEKRKEMERERRLEQADEVPLGPGGLNPYEVLESLPEEMRDCFEAQDIHGLQAVIAKMNPKEAKYHMKRCVDSGLWVPSDQTLFADDGSDALDAVEGKGEGEQEAWEAEAKAKTATAAAALAMSASDDIE